MAVLQSFLAIALLGRQACAYTWPNPLLEILDATRNEQLGPPGSARLGFDVVPCNPSIDVDGADSGRTNAADWLRTVSSLNHSFLFEAEAHGAQAYHDMATYDVTTGTVSTTPSHSLRGIR
jgi:hypothetical protein